MLKCAHFDRNAGKITREEGETQVIVESITLLTLNTWKSTVLFCTLTANADIIAKKSTVWYSSTRWRHMISTSPGRFQQLQPKYRNYSNNITYFRRWILNSGHCRRSCLHWSCGFWCFKCPIRVRAPLRKHRHNIGSRLFTNMLLNHYLWLDLNQRHWLIWEGAKPPPPNKAHLNGCKWLYLRFQYPVTNTILHHQNKNLMVQRDCYRIKTWKDITHFRLTSLKTDSF